MSDTVDLTADEAWDLLQKIPLRLEILEIHGDAAFDLAATIAGIADKSGANPAYRAILMEFAGVYGDAARGLIRKRVALRQEQARLKAWFAKRRKV